MNILNYILSLITTAIPQFSNTSITSIWYKMATVFADTCNLVLQELNNTLSIIQNTVNNNRFGKSLYYTSTALNYQESSTLYIGSLQGNYNAATNTPALVNGAGTAGFYYLVTVSGQQNFGNGVITFNIGDTVVYYGSLGQWINQPVGVVNNFIPYYETVDPDQMIVKQAAFVVNRIEVPPIPPSVTPILYDQCSLNVASADSNGFLIPLTNTQLSNFMAYMNEFTIPGIPLQIFSVNPNPIQFLNMNCYYQANYSQDFIATEVLNAFLAYLKITTLGAVFRTNSLEQYIVNNVKGVIDMSLFNAQILIEGNWVGFQDAVTMPAGYFNYVPNFQNNINYIPQNV